MNGKVLKVKQSNLEFGGVDRYVNVLGSFKYKTNGNVYIIYSDRDTKYNVIYYGSGHIRQGVVLCMPCRDKVAEEEFIKEYIFKVTQKEELDNFEIISLEDAKEIEIINSTKLEIKSEVLLGLIDATIPKDSIEEEKQEKVSKKKGSTFKSVLKGIVFSAIFLIACYYWLGLGSKEVVAKSITCVKKYSHNELAAMVEETNKYNFNVNDKLESIDTTMSYQFAKDTYNEFFLKGTHYKYMPSSNTEGGWSKDDSNYIFKVMTKKRVDTSYDDPVEYEMVLSYYKSNGYTCIEKIEN